MTKVGGRGKKFISRRMMSHVITVQASDLTLLELKRERERIRKRRKNIFIG